VHIYVDGGGVAQQANGSRLDVAAVFPQAGPSHGFSWSTSVAPGSHTVCAYAIDAETPWLNTPLGCRTVAVLVSPPLANWEVLSATAGSVTVSGWAFDPDQPLAASHVHVYVDGAGVASVPADSDRADVRAVFGVGGQHGFTWTRALAPGVHTVCVYAIDLDQSWRHTPLGCRSVTVP
jgi:hypothetical protein